MRRVLIIAFHFPPFSGSSGVQRALRFVQHLPRFGWEPIVLSAMPIAYESTSADLLAEVSNAVVVERAFALDARRHLSIRGRYPAFLAWPDRWMSWQFDAIRRGMRLFRKFSPDAIWSTYPIATAHLIGGELRNRTGLPWIADFRDPMLQNGYPADTRTREAFLSIEANAIRGATRSVFVTPGAARFYRARYADLDPSRFLVIENGFDEETFAAVEQAGDRTAPINAGKITLLHSGVVYPTERDPTQFFGALKALLDSKTISPNRLNIRFRAPGHEGMLREMVARFSLGALIEILPSIPYRDAIAEMLRADGLLIMQGASCNDQIPAKLYEYLRARRPLIGLVDPKGDTASAMRAAGIDGIAALESKAEIEALLLRALPMLAARNLAIPNVNAVETGSRLGRTRQLGAVLDDVVDR